MKRNLIIAAIMLLSVGCAKTSQITVKNLSSYRIEVSAGNTTYNGGIGTGIPQNATASFEIGYSGATTVGFYVAYFDVPGTYSGKSLWDFFKFSRTNPTQPVAGHDYLVIVTDDKVDVSLK